MAVPTGINKTDNKNSKTKENLFTKDQWELFENISAQIKKNGSYQEQLVEALANPGSFDLPDNPTVTNLKSARTLNLIIPTGFLMLHRDLEKLVEANTSQSGEKGSGWSLSSGGSLLASGLLAAAGLLGAGLISSSLSHLMDELLNEVSASELASDEDIKNSVKAGLATYIRVFFITQAAYLGINVLSKLLVLFEGFKGMFKGTSDVLGTIALGSSVIGTAANTIQDVFADLGLGSGSLEKRQAEAVFAIAEGVLNNIDTSDLINDESIQDSVKAGLAAYLKSYFYVQAAKLKINSVEDVASYFGAAVMTGGWSFVVDAGINMVGKIADLFTGGQATLEGRMQNLCLSIIESLFSETNVDDLSRSEEMQAAMKEGLGSYIKAYFYSQAVSLDPGNSNGFINQLFSNVAAFPKKLTEGILGSIESIANAVSGKQTIQDRIANLSAEIIENNLKTIAAKDVESPLFEEAVRSAISSLIANYFESLSLTTTGKKGFFEKAWDWLAGEDALIDPEISRNVIVKINDALKLAATTVPAKLDYQPLRDFYSRILPTLVDKLTTGLEDWKYNIPYYSETSQNLTAALDNIVNGISEYMASPDMNIAVSQNITNNNADIISSFKDDTVNLLTAINEGISRLENLAVDIREKPTVTPVAVEKEISYDLSVRQPE